MAPEEARRNAILKLGGIESTKQAHRGARTFPLLETTVQDIRYALRQLRRSPGFTATAVLMLGLGIGASVAIFAFVDAALIKPLPYADPTRLADVAEHGVAFPRSNISYQDFRDWQRLDKVFSSVEAYTGGGYLFAPTLRRRAGTRPRALPTAFSASSAFTSCPKAATSIPAKTSQTLQQPPSSPTVPGSVASADARKS